MYKSDTPRWRFPRLPPSHVNQDPVQGEFSTSSSDLPQRLVREAIQNSFDARACNYSVRVRFVFSGVEKAISRDLAARYLVGLKAHIAARPTSVAVANRGGEADAGDGRHREAVASSHEPMTVLAIEDFRATGLTGDIRNNPERVAGNDFREFFRRVSISTISGQLHT